MADETLRKVDKDTPLSVDIIYQLINYTLRSPKPLFLNGANLSGAYLQGFPMENAILIMTNLSEANLSIADLRGANLGMANLSGAN